MVRSQWKGLAALVLASAGLAYGQGVAPVPPSDGHTDHLLSVQEVGRPPLKCRILKSWYEPDGTRAFQVQAVSTGEMITILEGGASGVAPGQRDAKPVESQIIHWGPANHPPAGTPEAPKDAAVYGGQSPTPSASSPQPRTASDPAKPYAARTPPGGWPAAYAGQPPAKLQQSPAALPVKLAQAPVSTQTPVVRPEDKAVKKQPPAESAKQQTLPPTTPAPVAGKPPAVTAAKAPTAAPVPSAPVVAPAPSPMPTVTVKTPPPSPAPSVQVPPPSSTPVQQVKSAVPGANDPPVSKWSPVPVPLPSTQATAATPDSSAAVPAKLATTTTTVSVRTTEAIKPADSDWHQSWGKVEQPKSALLVSAAPPSPPPARPKVDPLMDPETYSRVKTDQMISRRFKEKGVAEEATFANSESPKKDAPTASDVKTVDVKQAVADAPAPKKLEPVPALPHPSASPPPPPPAPATAPVPVSSATPPSSQPPEATPPPAVQSASGKFLPPYIAAAATAAADAGGNAFSPPQPASRSNAGNTLASRPPSVSMMPGYSGASGSDTKWMQIPAAPPVIAAAPSAGVVAAGYPVSARPAAPSAVADGRGATLEQGLSASELLTTLQTSLYPSQREWAVDRLTACDWRADARVVAGLVKAAHSDPAPLVRAGCVRALARMKATSEPALATARDLMSDADQRVRQEAEAALGVLQTAAHQVRVTD